MLQCAVPRSFRQLTLLACAAALGCTDVTGPALDSSGPARNFTSQATGDLYITLLTDPSGAAESFSFMHDVGGNSNPVVGSPFTLMDGRPKIFNGIVAGSYTVTQAVPADWDLGTASHGTETRLDRERPRQDFLGGNRANDAAYALAAQLLAARLNEAAGAAVPECVTAVMGTAQELLGEPSAGVGFTGTGDYLGPKSSKERRAAASALANVLEHYNSGDITVAGDNCG